MSLRAHSTRPEGIAPSGRLEERLLIPRSYGVGLGSAGGGGVSLGGVSAGGISEGGGVGDGSVGDVLGVVVVSSGGGATSAGSFLAQPEIRNAAVSSANKTRMKVSFRSYTW